MEDKHKAKYERVFDGDWVTINGNTFQISLTADEELYEDSRLKLWRPIRGELVVKWSSRYSEQATVFRYNEKDLLEPDKYKKGLYFPVESLVVAKIK